MSSGCGGSPPGDRARIERQLPPAPKPGELSFFAIGDRAPADASERVDEHVARAVRRRRAPRS